MVLSPPPLPVRQPCFDGMWSTHSPRRSPLSSPHVSPHASRSTTPVASPNTSPNSLRRCPADAALPPIPKPYKGNSSLLRHQASQDSLTSNSSLDSTSNSNKNNINTPPLPARNPVLPNRLTKNRTNNDSGAFERTDTLVRKNGSLRVGKGSGNEAGSLTRRSLSDDNLDRSMDGESSQELSTTFQRSLSVSKSKKTTNNNNNNNSIPLYEPIFNHSASFLLPKAPSNSEIDHEPTQGSDVEDLYAKSSKKKEPKRLADINRKTRGSIKLDPNRPVPLPPCNSALPSNTLSHSLPSSSSTAHARVATSKVDVCHRPTTLAVFDGHSGSFSDGDSTPTLPPKKNKVSIRRSVSVEGGMSIGKKKSEVGKEELSAQMSLPLDSAQTLVKDGNSHKEKLSPFDDEFIGFALSCTVQQTSPDTDNTVSSDSSLDRKTSQVYYPWLNDVQCVSNIKPDNHAFYDEHNDEDDEPTRNYESPVPVITTPEVQPPRLFPPSPDTPSPGTPSSTEFSHQTGTKDPFSTDPFFNTVVTSDTPPPVPPHGTNSLHVTNGLPDETLPTTDSRLTRTIDPLTGKIVQAAPGRFFDRRQTSQDIIPIQYYDEDFEVLESQGYPREEIRRALTTAGNNFAIAKNILREYAPPK